VSAVEQDVATGQDVQGRAVKKQAAAVALGALLARADVQAADKLRLVLIFVACFRIESREEAQQLLHAAGLAHHARTVENLRGLCQARPAPAPRARPPRAR